MHCGLDGGIMEAKVITLINQKGGCGKTTISMNLAGTLAIRHNKRSLIIDGDNQASATKWGCNVAENESFPCQIISLAKTDGYAHREIAKFANQYDIIIIDCPPNTEAKFNASALLVSDLAIIPFSPSPLDLRAITEIKSLIEATSITNQKLQVRALVNMADNKNISKGIISHFKNNEDIELFDTFIKMRAIYRELELYGGVAYTSNNFQAKNEFALLSDEVINVIYKL